uniref:Uncharacterized protein n=1 Tax=Arundo donax TaxID=35708 RepID=A0A0A8YVH1_ARUDO
MNQDVAQELLTEIDLSFIKCIVTS